MLKRYDLVIINRSFWPSYPVIGEGLLRLAENLATNKKVAVITQDNNKIKKSLKKHNRGYGVDFFPTWSFSNSSSRFRRRILDAMFFTSWIFICLLITRPKKIYISTDPPILVPFFVSVYSNLVRLKYIYHLQDIHPNPSLNINKYFYKLFRLIDNYTMQKAHLLITLNKIMKEKIISLSNTKTEIAIVENPSIPIDTKIKYQKKRGFSFTGNLGRVQRIPLLIDVINNYERRGGTLEFEFAGDGTYSSQIHELSKNNSLVKYHGLVSSDQALKISSENEWALVPIEDNITQYAFPSKIASYIYSDAKLLAICSNNTSVAQWINSNKVGVVANPNLNEIVDILFKIEHKNIKKKISFNHDRKLLKDRLHMDRFVKKIQSKVI